jgi:hypothetical protein
LELRGVDRTDATKLNRSADNSFLEMIKHHWASVAGRQRMLGANNRDLVTRSDHVVMNGRSMYSAI